MIPRLGCLWSKERAHGTWDESSVSEYVHTTKGRKVQLCESHLLREIANLRHVLPSFLIIFPLSRCPRCTSAAMHSEMRERPAAAAARAVRCWLGRNWKSATPRRDPGPSTLRNTALGVEKSGKCSPSPELLSIQNMYSPEKCLACSDRLRAQPVLLWLKHSEVKNYLPCMRSGAVLWLDLNLHCDVKCQLRSSLYHLRIDIPRLSLSQGCG